MTGAVTRIGRQPQPPERKPSWWCRLGIHNRWRRSRNHHIWQCHGCPALWLRHHDRHGKWWEKIR